jgi:transposase-like protein
MGKRGRLYSPEFKEEALRLVHSSNERYPVAKIARDLDVSTETLRKWVNQTQTLRARTPQSLRARGR